MYFSFYALCFFHDFSCVCYLSRKEEIQYSDVGWAECHGVLVRQLRFRHMSIRKGFHAYTHKNTTNISVSSDPYSAHIEPPALIVYLMVKGLQMQPLRYRGRLGAPRCSLIERWQVEINVCTSSSSAWGEDQSLKVISGQQKMWSLQQKQDNIVNQYCGVIMVLSTSF